MITCILKIERNFIAKNITSARNLEFESRYLTFKIQVSIIFTYEYYL